MYQYEIIYRVLFKDFHILELQGKLVPKLTLGPFLSLSVRNGPSLQSYLFQPYMSLNPTTPYIYKD